MLKTVLIAEDHADIRSMTKFMVESCGYNVVEARDGYEAFEEAKETHPDLILMDIAMPLMNGITAATLIRNSGVCDDVPIVAVTAYGREYVNTAEEFGFDGILLKPIGIDDIRDLLGQYLEDAGPGPQNASIRFH